MKTISFGKYRGLTQVSTPQLTMSILALDHRNNLRKAFNPKNPNLVSDDDIAAFKSEVVNYVAPAASAVLLDPQIGAFQSIANGSLPGDKGLICAIEETGYTGDPISRMSKVLPGWDAAKAKRMGASGIKLLVYYHPKSDRASQIEQLICQVAETCENHEIPLFLEPLSYSLVEGVKISPGERRSVVLETASRLTRLGVDVLKAEFPVDTIAETSEKVWSDACSELSEASSIPWVLLSASVDFDTYFRQVEIACDSGCSGVAAGRAVWKEAVTYNRAERISVLMNLARKRMEKLTRTCNTLGKPWGEFFNTPVPDPTWYQSY